MNKGGRKRAPDVGQGQDGPLQKVAQKHPALGLPCDGQQRALAGGDRFA